jgi:hypothetical protein
MKSPLEQLANAQDEVVSRAQLSEAGVDRWRIRNAVGAQRWRAVGPLVVVLHNGPLTWRQRCWCAVLNAGPEAALSGRTALGLAGMRGEHPSTVEIVVGRGNRVAPLAGVVMTRTRHRIESQGAPARQPAAIAAVHAAIRAPTIAIGGGLLASTVQQGLAPASGLRAALVDAGAVRYRRTLFGIINDIEAGSQAFSELNMSRLCRGAGLPTPRHQSVRTDHDGRRRFMDLDLDGLLIEIDGAPHLDVLRQTDDCFRHNERTLASEPLLRFTGLAVRTEPERVLAQIRRGLAISPKSVMPTVRSSARSA